MLDLKKLKEEHENLFKELSSPQLLKDREKYSQVAKRFAYLEKIINLSKKHADLLKERKHLEEIITDSKETEEMKSLARQELEELTKSLKKTEQEIEDKVFEETEVERDVIIEIRPAAGGDEAGLFAATLFKMYSRYAEKNNWKLEVLSSQPTEIGGFKDLSFSLKGKAAYSRLKFESGVHRVQRVPVTESGGRIHTSTVTVAVLIEPKEVELKINPDDLKIDTYRSSGAGGQHVNVTDSAVRITHLPSGLIVTCQDERSQIKNRAKALRVLKARLMEKMIQDETDKLSKTRKFQVGTGERSEKIRTYNFPERRVTDHRINFTLYKLEAVLEGDLDTIVNELIKEERKRIYEAKGLA